MSAANRSKSIQNRVKFVRLNAANYKTFPAILSGVNKHAPKALTDLYEQIASTPETSHFFSSEHAMKHAQEKQMDHWRQLFSRPLDESYMGRAEKIGHIHAKIGLEPTWYIGA